MNALNINLILTGVVENAYNIDNSLLALPDRIEKLLHEYGSQIIAKSGGTLSYVVTTGSALNSNEIESYSLYVIAPAIRQDYRVLTFDKVDINHIEIRLWSRSGQMDANTPIVSIIDQTLSSSICTFLSSPLTAMGCQHLINLSSLRD